MATAAQLQGWLVLLLVAACWTHTTVAPAPRYHCAPAPLQERGHCGPGCQASTGDALIQLFGGLSRSLDPWYQQKSGSMCSSSCSMPAYCSWAGVTCCYHTAPDSDSSTSANCQPEGSAMCPDSSVGNVWQLDVTQFGLNGSLSDDVMDALGILTRHGLHSIDLSSNKISGSIPARIAELGSNLTLLNLNFNRLTGTIPPEIAQLQRLQHLFLSFNKLTGSLQGRFCTETNDPLEVLILRANRLEGPVDMQACRNLILLDVTDNFLTGTLPIGLNNSKLVSFRGTNNKFSGPINTQIWQLPVLTTIDIANNDLNGTISPYCGTSNNLVNVYLGNNSLRGTIPGNLTSNSQLLILELQNNTGLYGTFPKSDSMVGIRRLDIHNTSIRGTIPEEWGELPYLEYVDITNTRMSCCENQSQVDDPSFPQLPSFLQFSKKLSQYDLGSNAVHLMDASEDMPQDQPNNILCRSVVRKHQKESEWNKLQLPITSNNVDAQQWQISPLYYWFDNCTCTKFYNQVPGARYRYTGVDIWCNDAHNKMIGNVSKGPCLDMSIFTCTPLTQDKLTPAGKAAIGVTVPIVTLIILALVVYMMLARASKLRRYINLAAIRLKGPPRYGRMTLVVTDIEGYSDIFRRSPEVMFRALVLHNSVLRAAKYANGGFVLEQEGDSFTIAFYDPFDAVVFCLQSQQALLAVDWPAGLEEEAEDAVAPHGSMSSYKTSKLQMRLSSLLTAGPRLKRVNTTQSTASSGIMELQPGLSGSQWGNGSKGNLGENVLFNGLRVRMGVVMGDVPSGTPIKNSALFQLAKVVGDFGNGGQIIVDDATFAAIKEHSHLLGAVEATGLNHRKMSTGRARWLCRLLGCARPTGTKEEAIILDMGAFCHLHGDDDTELPYTTSRTLDVKLPDEQRQQPSSPCCLRSGPGPWWQRLKCCSPCGWRGSTLDDLSSNEEDGFSSEVQQLPPAAQQSRAYLGSRAAASKSHSTSVGALSGPSSASAASQGLNSPVFHQPSSTQSHDSQLHGKRQLSSTRQHSTDEAREQEAQVVGRLASFSAKMGNKTMKQLETLRKTLVRNTSSLQRSPSSRRDWESVRLYQVLPPSLAGRAHTWHNQLNVKDGWICWDNIYFEAPGSTLAPLTGGNLTVLTSAGSSTAHQGSATSSVNSHIHHRAHMASPDVFSSGDSPKAHAANPSTCSAPPAIGTVLSNPCLLSPLLQPLPNVTMVFMAVEGPDQLVRRRRSFTPAVQQQLNRVVRDALRRLGGYLCRVQEGDLKFMLAFASPVTALEWCLVVQSAAMYLPWPQSAIMLLPSCKEQVDGSGRLVYRGPRLKMGVCEGVPRSILPDHEGRADYHGQSINMAARYMDKGAQGGQISCTLELAQKVMGIWAAGTGDISSNNGSSNHNVVAAGFGRQRRPSMNGITEHHASEDAAVSGAAAAVPVQLASAASDPRSDTRDRNMQPLSIELPPELAVAGRGNANGGNDSSSSGGASHNPCIKNNGSSNGSSSSKTRFGRSSGGGVAPDSSHQGAGCLAEPTPFFSWPGNASSVSLCDQANHDAADGAAPVSGDHHAASTSHKHGSFFSAKRSRPPRSSSPGSLGGGWQGPSTTSGIFLSLQPTSPASSTDLNLQPGVLTSPVSGAPAAAGDVSQHHHHQQQQQQHPSRMHGLVPPLRLSHLRASTGGSHTQRSLHSHCGGLSQQQQPAVVPVVPPVAPSPFVIKDVTKARFQVEVHRLGLYSFKGGPPQQEMVQVVASHLLGRLDLISAAPPPATSRKGQLLQRLEGQVGEPVLVELPALAQEYHSRLPGRISGLTGLPHALSSTNATAATGPHQQPGFNTTRLGGQPWSSQQQRTGPMSSKSMTLPARTNLWATPAAADNGWQQRYQQGRQQHEPLHEQSDVSRASGLPPLDGPPAAATAAAAAAGGAAAVIGGLSSAVHHRHAAAAVAAAEGTAVEGAKQLPAQEVLLPSAEISILLEEELECGARTASAPASMQQLPSQAPEAAGNAGAAATAEGAAEGSNNSSCEHVTICIEQQGRWPSSSAAADKNPSSGKAVQQQLAAAPVVGLLGKQCPDGSSSLHALKVGKAEKADAGAKSEVVAATGIASPEGLGPRHDSFRSVGDELLGAVEQEELGLASSALAAPRSKSDSGVNGSMLQTAAGHSRTPPGQ